MTPLELLRQLNELDEHSRIEAKTASDLGRSLLETVCAFSNEPGLGGGWIVLGAKADESSFFRQYLAVGLSDPDKIQRDLASACTTTFNRPIRVQIESGIVNGRNLLSVFVPEVPPGANLSSFKTARCPLGLSDASARQTCTALTTILPFSIKNAGVKPSMPQFFAMPT